MDLGNGDGDTRVTRYRALANPLRFTRFDGRPTDRRPSSKLTLGRNRNDAMPGRAFSVLSEQIGPYHKTPPYTTSCEALPASNFLFKMGRWGISKVEHRIVSYGYTNTSIERRGAGRNGP